MQFLNLLKSSVRSKRGPVPARRLFAESIPIATIIYGIHSHRDDYLRGPVPSQRCLWFFFDLFWEGLFCKGLFKEINFFIEPEWRNWIARPTSNRKVASSTLVLGEFLQNHFVKIQLSSHNIPDIYHKSMINNNSFYIFTFRALMKLQLQLWRHCVWLWLHQNV